MAGTAGSSALPSVDSPKPPKVEQVLHARAKTILSCTFARSAASNRSGVAPPPSYQSVTVGGTTTLLNLNPRDATMRTVGAIDWDLPQPVDEGKQASLKRGARVTIGEHTSEFSDVLRRNKSVGKDLLLKSEPRVLCLPGSESPLHFQRVAIPSSGFPYTVYTIADTSLPPGPTHAHICVGQLTVKQNIKNQGPKPTPSASRFPFFSSPSSPGQASKPPGVTIRLEIRTRDKALIDKLVFGSLLMVAAKHPTEADARVELDRPVENEWDAPPALSTLVTPHLTPNHSSEHLPTAAPEYRDGNSNEQLFADASSQQALLGPDPFGVPGPGPSSLSMAESRASSGSSLIAV
ncbi:hypothetical protein BDV93DRAFT_521730 [Ceratobasidium sp. AG-I]|nr:hypothetical protein BDV93DRAFT_521730 [Ceratobasidium sp. AG-I]